MSEYRLQRHRFTSFASVLGESPSLVRVVLAMEQEMLRRFHILAASRTSGTIHLPYAFEVLIDGRMS